MSAKVAPIRQEAAAEPDRVVAKGTNLDSKMAAIVAAVGRIEKRGMNKEQNYKFASESDITDAVKRECYAHNVSLRFAPVPGTLTFTPFETSRGTKGVEAFLEMRMILKDADDPTQVIEEVFPGIARDYGDKALPKAITSAKKLAHICTFNISTGDDPERDGAGNEDLGVHGRAPEPTEEEKALNRAIALTGSRIARLNVPLDDVAKITEELTGGTIKDYTELNVEGLRKLLEIIIERYHKKPAAGENAGTTAAEQLPDDVTVDREPQGVTAAAETAGAAASSDAAPTADEAPSKEAMIAWVAERMAAMGAADDSDDVLQITSDVSIEMSGTNTYVWRNLPIDQLREFWRRFASARKNGGSL